ncbi:hypothetical protein [Nostoc sp. NMS4]|uniref:hypothetical protein n=1 Tax=Nostoc sp. NMS4 TaxID=2815390 RepID=UPI0025FCB55C|nr:hypothetical protein [Nostoc sp. NMS4]MBN3926099.1 hypothetical protein [Nostoc sp. NMS4]
MKVTTITYQRVLNMGDYNSCRLEKTALADEFEDQEIATQNLIESVLRQIHESAIQNQIDKEIRGQRKELAALKAEYAELSKQVELLKAEQTSTLQVEDDRF